jgi:hypothetical protein
MSTLYGLHILLADVATVTSASTVFPSMARLKSAHDSHPFSDIFLGLFRCSA